MGCLSQMPRKPLVMGSSAARRSTRPQAHLSADRSAASPPQSAASACPPSLAWLQQQGGEHSAASSNIRLVSECLTRDGSPPAMPSTRWCQSQHACQRKHCRRRGAGPYTHQGGPWLAPPECATCCSAAGAAPCRRTLQEGKNDERVGECLFQPQPSQCNHPIILNQHSLDCAHLWRQFPWPAPT